MTEYELLGKEKIGKLLVRFSIPSVISLVLNAVYNMVDQIFIGNGVGYLGNGATNVIFPLTMFGVAFGVMFGDGASSFLNLRLGQGKKDEAAAGMAAGLIGSVISGLLMTVGFVIFLKPLCLAFGATDQTLPYALDYGYIICAGMIFSVFDSCTMSLIRADGSPQFAMWGLVAGCVTNLIGDPLTIFVFNMGVRGAALATVAGQIVNAAMNIWYLSGHTKSVRLSRKVFKEGIGRIGRVAAMGAGSLSTQLCIVIVLFAQNNLLVYFGAKSVYGAEIPMTALGVIMKVFTVLQNMVNGLAGGAQPIFSYNYGHGDYARVKKTLNIVLLWSLLIFAAATAWFQLAPMSVVRIFGQSDELYNRFAVLCLRIFLGLLVMDAFQMVASPYLQSVGKAGKASFLILLRQIIVQIPAMIIFAILFGVEGILYAGPLSSAVVGVAAIILMRKENKVLLA